MSTRKKLQRYIPLLSLIVLAAFFRLFWLDRIPNAIAGDELTYLISAKSIMYTGHDLTGTWNPLSAFIFRYPPNEQQAELEYFIHLPFSGIFPYSLFVARLPVAILSIGIVILLYFIARKLFDRPTAIAVGAMAAINPWLIYIGRTSYEWSIAMFFYLLGVFLILQKNKTAVLLSIVAFLLGFYSYIGTKIIFIPFVGTSLVLGFILNGKKYVKQYMWIGIISILITAFYLVCLKTSTTATRLSEVFLPNNSTIASEVDYFRKISIPSPLSKLYVNKATVYIQILITKLYNIFSPTYLFLQGDEFFSLWNYGFFHVIDVLFLAIGSFYLFIKRKRIFFILITFICIGTITQLFHINSRNFSYHIAFMFPFMIFIIGAGITSLIRVFPAVTRKIVLSIILLMYLAGVGKFIYVYVYQHPLQGYFDFHARVLSAYLKTAQRKTIAVTVYSDANSDYFRKFLFYTNGITKDTISQIPALLNASSFGINGVQFKPCDLQADIQKESGIVIIDIIHCQLTPAMQHLSISKLSDGGEIYRIYNDSICKDYTLKRYSQNITIDDFAMDKLTTERFCETYISRLL